MRIEKSLFYQRLLFIAFWIRGVWCFFSSDLVPLAMTLQTVVFLFFDAVLVALGIVMMSRKRDMLYAAAFVVLGYISTCFVNNLSLVFYLNGLRDFIPYLFIIPIIRYFFSNPERKERFVQDFDKQLFGFLVVQVPATIFQFCYYGAGDWVGGTLGFGYSGVLSTLIFAISFYLMKKRIDPDRYLSSLWENKVLILLLIPTQLNETKISFIFILMYFLLLMPMNRKLFMRMVIAIPVMCIMMYGLALAYVVSTGNNASDIFSLEFYYEMYLYDGSGDSEAYAQALMDEDSDIQEDVPRFSKLMLLDDVHHDHPGHGFWGFGVGHYKGGTVTEYSQFYKEYEWLLVGSVPYIFHLWIQLGFIGVVLMIVFFWNLFASPQKGLKRDYGLQFFFILTFIMIMVYNDSIRSAIMMLPITYIIMASWKERTGSEDDECDEEESEEVREMSVS